MGTHVSIVRGGIIAIGAAMGLTGGGIALAGPAGGAHVAAGGHFAAGGHVGGGFHAGYGGFRGGYYGGYRGGWAGRPYYGWRGYYGWRAGWGCCGWGWPWVGLGLYVPVLPVGYSTVYWGGVPYYYANNYYYVWDSGAGQYQAVEPPSGVSGPANSSAARSPTTTQSSTWTDLYAYPKAGQSTEQQARDRDECHKWAVAQSGFDPAQPTHDTQDQWAARREGYLRAEAACLEARNYSVK
jgi:hypothetical protein